MIANELHSRHKQVWLIDAMNEIGDENSTRLEKVDGIDLEEMIVQEVVAKHYAFLGNCVDFDSSIPLNCYVLSSQKQLKVDSNGHNDILSIFGIVKLKKTTVEKILEMSGPLMGAIISHYIMTWARNQRQR